MKSAYVTQLHLYAAIYAEDIEVSGGAWPERLELVPPGSNPVPVDFDPAECTQLLDSAEAALDDLNALIRQPARRLETELLLARPSGEACRWCAYRPACQSYMQAASGRADQEGWPGDVWGTVADLRRVGNGTTSLTINASGQPVRVRGLSSAPEYHPVLGQLQPEAGVAVFNVVAQGGTRTRGEGAYTVIYPAPQGVTLECRGGSSPGARTDESPHAAGIPEE